MIPEGSQASQMQHGQRAPIWAVATLMLFRGLGGEEFVYRLRPATF